jgi:hypothetical protein
MAAGLCCLSLASSAPAAEPPSASGGHVPQAQTAPRVHSALREDIRRLDLYRWRSGYWRHGDYRGRRGWWWIVGASWYWYPAAISPYPDPYTPPGLIPGWYYWCSDYQQYYPLVGDCPSAWEPEPPQ